MNKMNLTANQMKQNFAHSYFQCLLNRYLIDGPGSKTVRNGFARGHDERYTKRNTFMAGKSCIPIFSFYKT